MSRDNKPDTESLSPTQFVLMLHSIPHLGEKTLTRLLHHNAQNRLSPDACLALSPEEWHIRYALDPRSLAYLNAHRDALLLQSAELARTVRQIGLHVLTPQSLTYPDRLERFDDSPPPILYALGNLALLDQTRSDPGRQISINEHVSSRIAEQSDEQYAQNLEDALPEPEESEELEQETKQQEVERQKAGQSERASRRKLTNRELYNISTAPRIETIIPPIPTYQNTSGKASQTIIPAIAPRLKARAKLEAKLGLKLEAQSSSETEKSEAKVSLETKTGSDTGVNAGFRPFLFSIAVSNGATPAVLTRQDEIAEKLVACGCVPVTGHDRAAYKRLALSAQRLNRPTIYVMDRGLREALGPAFDRPPFSAARIRDTVFDVKRDLALSSFRLDDHALGGNNRRRDRTIYALADVIIALDVRAGGGMVAECLRAHAQGRIVWVAEGGRDGNEELRQAGCPSLPS